MLNKNYLLAYAHFRAAYLAERWQAHLLVNLGYLYHLKKDYTFAESAYQQAIRFIILV